MNGRFIVVVVLIFCSFGLAQSPEPSHKPPSNEAKLVYPKDSKTGPVSVECQLVLSANQYEAFYDCVWDDTATYMFRWVYVEAWIDPGIGGATVGDPTITLTPQNFGNQYQNPSVKINVQTPDQAPNTFFAKPPDYLNHYMANQPLLFTTGPKQAIRLDLKRANAVRYSIVKIVLVGERTS